MVLGRITVFAVAGCAALVPVAAVADGSPPPHRPAAPSPAPPPRFHAAPAGDRSAPAGERSAPAGRRRIDRLPHGSTGRLAGRGADRSAQGAGNLADRFASRSARGTGKTADRLVRGGRGLASVSAHPGFAPAIHAVSRAEEQEAGAYWTARRMELATPAGSVAAAPSSVWARHFPGLWNVGALFYHDGRANHFCTASVVGSRHGNLLLTAGHCLYNPGHGYFSRLVFVPKYLDGERPLGTWRIQTMAVDRRWVRSADPDLDFGFATLHSLGGRQIASLVHPNRLATDQGFRNYVHVIGYPGATAHRADTAIDCGNVTSRAGRFQVRFDCGGYTSGTSGSPWMAHFNPATGTGDIVGVIGGLHQGGYTSSVSYSAYFDHDIQRLYGAAAALR